MDNCFDYSRCSLFSPFYVYIYEEFGKPKEITDESIEQIIQDRFRKNIHITHDPRIACIYLLIVEKNSTFLRNKNYFQNYLHSLPYWAGMIVCLFVNNNYKFIIFIGR